jgi:hypothetical protein
MPINYAVPGNADSVSTQILNAWNETIQQQYERLAPDLGSRFFGIDPQTVPSPTPTTAVKWFADPAEPVGCIDREYARLLSDWDIRGRHALHNEYAEYHVIQRPDPNTGRPRNKRVEVTTELREYWVCVARQDPDAVRSMAGTILGTPPAWQDLYGVADPTQLTPAQREVAFCRLVAGHGNDPALTAQGVPAQPIGPLNTEHALFMTHPINGLDDLLYIVMFGAKPYARRVNNQLVPATRNQIFRAFGVEHLACRHADPAAAIGAHAQVFNGRTVAFANPLGMYLINFAKGIFLYQNQAVSDAWVWFSRGQTDLYQRLEFGPPDDHPAFLDEIEVDVGGVPQRLTGGYQILQQLEVGPVVLISPPSVVGAQDYVILNTSTAPINCREAGICPEIRALQAEYEAAHPLVRVGPRLMGREV